jgi:hypothetical protein
VRTKLYLFQFAFDIGYLDYKNNIVPDILSLFTYLKYDSDSLFENKNIFENIINKYYYSSVIVIEMSNEFKNSIKRGYDNENR